jgi:membrane-associated phospholipid phosphatase
MVTAYPAPVRVKRGATVISKFWSIAILGLTLCPAAADSKIETAGTAIAIGMPLLAGGITAYKHDWTGSAQLVVTTVLTVGTAYGLKQIVKECRPFAKPCTPHGGNWDSFPSDTSALASAPAGFLWRRYGWEYGLPAFAASAFVGYSRVDAKKHHWWDTAASTGISLIYNGLITTRYHRSTGFYSSLDGNSDGAYATVGYRW